MDDDQRIRQLEAAIVALLGRVGALETAAAQAGAAAAATPPLEESPIQKEVRCVDEGVRVSGLATRFFQAAGDDYDLSIQFTLANTQADFEVIACEIQALDADGFALEESGHDVFVPSGEHETVRRLIPMKRDIAARVRGLSLRCQGVDP